MAGSPCRPANGVKTMSSHPCDAQCGLCGCKNRPAPFSGGCRKSQLNQALSVLSLSLGFFNVSVVLLAMATFYIVLFCVIYVFCLLVVLVRLSVPVQVIDWKDSSPK